MKMKRMKKALALLAVLAMIFSLLPMTAMADDEAAAQINDGEIYPSLEAALSAAQDGDTITLLKSSEGNGLYMDADRFTGSGLTINLNDHTYSITGTGVGVEHNIGIFIGSGNKVTFTSQDLIFGIISNEDSQSSLDTLIESYGDLSMEGISAISKYENEKTLGIYGGTANINGSLVMAPLRYEDEDPVCRGYSLYVAPDVSANVALDSSSYISGDIGLAARTDMQSLNLLLNCDTAIVPHIKIDPSIDPVMHKVTVTKPADSWWFVIDRDDTYEWKNNTTLAKIIPQDAAAQVRSDFYNSLEEALAAATDGDTITLLKSSEGNGLYMDADSFTEDGLTIDLNGFNYIISGTGVGNDHNIGIFIGSGNKVTFTDHGSASGGTLYNTSGGLETLIQNDGELTLLEIEAYLFKPQYTDADKALYVSGGTVTLNSSAVRVNSAAEGYALYAAPGVSADVTTDTSSISVGKVGITVPSGESLDHLNMTLDNGIWGGDSFTFDVADSVYDNISKVNVSKAAGTNYVIDPADKFCWENNTTLIRNPSFYEVAQINNGEIYPSLEAALAEAQDGDTITLLRNCEGNGLYVEANSFAESGLTIDLNNFKYSITGIGVGDGDNIGIFIGSGNKVTFTSQDFIFGIISNEDSQSSLDTLIESYGDLTMERISVRSKYESEKTLGIYGGTVRINGSLIMSPTRSDSEQWEHKGYALYMAPNVSADVTLDSSSLISGDIGLAAGANLQRLDLTLDSDIYAFIPYLKIDPSIDTVMDKVTVKKPVARDLYMIDRDDMYYWKSGTTLTRIDPPDAAARIGGTHFNSLEAALAAAQDGDTITLLKNCSGKGLNITSGKFRAGLTIDFNGFSYNITGSGVGPEQKVGILIGSGNKVIFTDENADTGGTLYNTSGGLETLIQNDGELTLYEIEAHLFKEQYTDANNTLYVSGGTVTLNRSAVSINSVTEGYALYAAPGVSANVTTTSDSITFGKVGIAIPSGESLVSLDMTLNNGILAGDPASFEVADSVYDNMEKIHVSKAAGTNYVIDPADKFCWENNTTLARNPAFVQVAQINNGDIYPSLEAALAAATDGDRIKLLKDSSGNGLYVEANRFAVSGLTIDLNDCMYSITGDGVGDDLDIGILIESGNKVTFTSPTLLSGIIRNVDSLSSLNTLIKSYGDLTMNRIYAVSKIDNDKTLGIYGGTATINESLIMSPTRSNSGTWEHKGYSLYVAPDVSANVTLDSSSLIAGDIGIAAGADLQSLDLTLNSDVFAFVPYLKIDPSIDNVADKVHVTKPAASEWYLIERKDMYYWENGTTLKKKEPKFASRSLVLTDQIGVRFHMDFSGLKEEDIANSSMTFQLNQMEELTIPASQAKKEGGKYIFICPTNVLQMADTITATFSYGNGKTIVDEYSVKDYVEYVAGHTGEFTDKEVNLVKAIADYGQYAQAYLSEEHNFTVGEGGKYAAMTGYKTAEQLDVEGAAAATEKFKAMQVLEGSKVQNLQLKLSLDSRTALSIRAVVPEGVTVTGEAFFVTTNYEFDKNAVAKVTGIRATLLDDNAYINGDAGGRFGGTACALSYAHAALVNSSSSASLKNAMAALYNYYAAVIAYLQK